MTGEIHMGQSKSTPLVRGRYPMWVLVVYLVLSGGLLWIALQFIENRENARFFAQEREQVIAQLSDFRLALARELNAEMYLGQILRIDIEINGDITQARFNGLSHHLLGQAQFTRSTGLSRGYTIAYVYPESANNAAIGLDYQASASQWPGIQKATTTKKAVLVGPVPLAQGGESVIGRIPVFVGNATTAEQEFFGIVSLVMDSGRFRARIRNLSENLALALTLDDSSTPFAGDPEILTDNPVTMTMSFLGGDWNLYAKPQAGWTGHSPLIAAYRLGVAGLAVGLWVMLGFIWHLGQRRFACQEQLQIWATTDALTGLVNRRHAYELAYAQLAHPAQDKASMCAVIILDFDDFKAINDQWGHDIGDVVLQEMGKVLKDNVRATDIVCRFGGEEFLLVLFHLQDGDAEKRAESLRSHIAETVVQADGVAVTITASLGVTVKSHPDKQQFDTMVHVADKAMYQAKHAGKNRVVTVP